MLTNRTELEICLWDRDASAFYALLEYSIIQSNPIQVIQYCCCHFCIWQGYVYRTRCHSKQLSVRL